MNKIIKLMSIGLLCAGLTGCVSTVEEKPSGFPWDKVVEPAAPASLIYTAFNEDANKFFSEYYGGITQVVDQMQGLGKTFPLSKLVDINGQSVDLADYENKNVVIEMVAEWCGYCKEQAKHLDEIIKANPDITFIQMFADGTAEKVMDFYKELEMSIPENLIVIPQSDEVIEIADFVGLQSFPTAIFKDINNKIGWSHLGFLEAEAMNGLLPGVFNNKPIYEQLVDGVTLEDISRDSYAVFEDLTDEAIAEIEKVTKEQDAMSTIYGNLGRKLEVTPFKDIDGSMFDTKVFENKKVVYSFFFATDDIPAVNTYTEGFEALKARYSDVTFINVIFPYDEEVTVKDYAKENIPNAIVIDVSDIENTPSFIDDVALYYVPTLLFQDEYGYIAGALVGEYSKSAFDKAFDVYYNGEQPIYTMVK